MAAWDMYWYIRGSSLNFGLSVGGWFFWTNLFLKLNTRLKSYKISTTQKNLWVHQIQSPACLSLDFINELLDKMHSWFLYVHALYMMVGSSWILKSCNLWNGLPKHHTHRKSRPLGREIPHWAPTKNGISIFRLARLTISDACCARVIFKKT